jgi:hypothetical protein
MNQQRTNYVNANNSFGKINECLDESKDQNSNNQFLKQPSSNRGIIIEPTTLINSNDLSGRDLKGYTTNYPQLNGSFNPYGAHQGYP